MSKKIKLVVPGRVGAIDGTKSLPFGREGSDTSVPSTLSLTTRTTVDMDAIHRGTGETVEFNATKDDLVELVYANGIKEWMTVEELQHRVQQHGVVQPSVSGDRGGYGGETEDASEGDSANPDEVRIPISFESEQSRGATELVLQTLKVLGLDIPKAMADRGTEWLVDKIEGNLKPGLYELRDPKENAKAGPQGDILQPHGHALSPHYDKIDRKREFSRFDLDKPFLILLHGTFSSIAGSFHSLIDDPETWAALRAKYDNRILALQHKTISESPAKNAYDIARLMPKGAKLHIISHSRGGLVGELLCMGDIDDDAIDELEELGRHDAEILKKLDDELGRKRFQIERFLRVACPARGTTLASKKTDQWLSIILNLMGQIPALGSSPLYDIAQASILTLIKQKEDPAKLPGLEAMMPTSPFIQMLNRAKIQDKTEFAIVAGDIEAEGLFKKLAIWVTDRFYSERFGGRAQHDLVVDTDSMFKGVQREGRGYYAFFQGPSVNHLDYFEQTDSRKAVVDWLLADDVTKVQRFKKQVGEPVPIYVRSARERSTGSPTAIVRLIPGFMGCQLFQAGDCLWFDEKALGTGTFADLQITSAARNRQAPSVPVTVGELIGAGYRVLDERLHYQFDLQPFAYDWRISLLEESKRLASELEAHLNGSTLPLHLIAHSTGGLLVRAMFAQNPTLCDELLDRQSKIILLGTPHYGTYYAADLLSGKAHLTHMLNLLGPLGQPADKNIVQTFRTWPALFQMLPSPAKNSELWKPAWWKETFDIAVSKAPMPGAATFQKQLEAAADFHEMQQRAEHDRIINNLLSSGNVYNILGDGLTTVADMRTDIGGSEENNVLFARTQLGDGVVDHELASVPGLPNYYVNTAHGHLIDHHDVVDAVADILETGEVNTLQRSPMSTSRGVVLHLPEEPVVLYPTSDDLVAAAYHRPTASPNQQESLTLRLRVTHGSLEYARHPVAVGHYDQDVFVGAEKFLDHQLGGSLSQRLEMNLYPGPVDTCEVVLTPNCEPKGGLVVGLGEIGTITPAVLTRGVTKAALRMALMIAEDPSIESTESGWRSAAVSTVLIGTNGGRALNVESSIVAFVKGILMANRILRERRLWDKVRIDEIEFIEYFEDLAIHAAHTVKKITEHLRMTLEPLEQVVGADRLYTTEGGRSARPSFQYDDGWWRRLQITSLPGKTTINGERSTVETSADGTGAGGLQFVLLTDRARAEEVLQATQRKLVDSFVENAIQRSHHEADLAVTLFELLLPNSLKNEAQEAANMLMVLDRDSAQYPWEMLADRSVDGQVRPLAIHSGMLRQLKTDIYRRQVQSPRGKVALVVGDPELGTHSKLQQLPGARREAESVVRILEENSYDVEQVIGNNGLEVINALYKREYRILHVAGHGEYNADHPERSGVVLGNGIFLTAAEIGQLRVVPELVFLNCCHLAQVDSSDHSHDEQTPVAWNKLAASIAEELIKIGVRAVVAAGWAVDDAAAKTFAEVFYQRMLSKSTYSEAVHHARQQTREQYQYTNTWGAYQCYGVPNFALSATTSTRTSSDDSIRQVAASEVVQELDRICLQAGTDTRPGARERLLGPVNELYQRIPDEWKSGQMYYKFGLAFGELGDFEQAIAAYQRAINLHGIREQVPIHAVGELANFESRRAEELRAAAQATTDKDRKAAIQQEQHNLNEAAQRHIQLVLDISPTGERSAFAGGVFKRIAIAAETDSDAQKMLNRAAEEYTRALDARRSETGRIDHYPALNLAILFYIATQRGFDLPGLQGMDEARVLADIAESKEIAREQEQRKPSYWNRTAEPDGLLLRALIEGNLVDREHDIQILYEKALGTRGTIRQKRSTLDQIDMLINLALSVKDSGGKASNGSKKKTIDESTLQSLRRLRKSLDKSI